MPKTINKDKGSAPNRKVDSPTKVKPKSAEKGGSVKPTLNSKSKEPSPIRVRNPLRKERLRPKVAGEVPEREPEDLKGPEVREIKSKAWDGSQNPPKKGEVLAAIPKGEDLC